jgi:hypothetical protein
LYNAQIHTTVLCILEGQVKDTSLIETKGQT